MAVRTHQVEGGAWNSDALELSPIARPVGNDVRAELAEAYCVFSRRRLSDHDQVEAPVIEPLKNVLARAVWLELQAQPRKAIAGM